MKREVYGVVDYFIVECNQEHSSSVVHFSRYQFVEAAQHYQENIKRVGVLYDSVVILVVAGSQRYEAARLSHSVERINR